MQSWMQLDQPITWCGSRMELRAGKFRLRRCARLPSVPGVGGEQVRFPPVERCGVVKRLIQDWARQRWCQRCRKSFHRGRAGDFACVSWTPQWKPRGWKRRCQLTLTWRNWTAGCDAREQSVQLAESTRTLPIPRMRQWQWQWAAIWVASAACKWWPQRRGMPAHGRRHRWCRWVKWIRKRQLPMTSWRLTKNRTWKNVWMRSIMGPTVLRNRRNSCASARGNFRN